MTLLKYPKPGCKLAIWVDASDVAIGGVLQQQTDDGWEPLSFFSVKLSKSQRKWSTYDRELFAIYSSIKRFRHMVEGLDFSVFTDHKPLTFAFLPRQDDSSSPRQARHKDFIAQFTTDIRHVKGEENVIADALSRVEIDAITNGDHLDFAKMSKDQTDDNDLQQELSREDSPFKFEKQPVLGNNCHLTCDMSTGSARPFVPKTFWKIVFDHLHGLAHPGVSATQKLISSR